MDRNPGTQGLTVREGFNLGRSWNDETAETWPERQREQPGLLPCSVEAIIRSTDTDRAVTVAPAQPGDPPPASTSLCLSSLNFIPLRP